MRPRNKCHFRMGTGGGSPQCSRNTLTKNDTLKMTLGRARHSFSSFSSSLSVNFLQVPPFSVSDSYPRPPPLLACFVIIPLVFTLRLLVLLLLFLQKRSGDPNPQYFSKSTAVQMGGVLPWKWEAYCSTNGRRTAGFPFLRSLEAGKVWRYKWGGYCRTNWRCTAVLFRQVVGVGVSETLPISAHLHLFPSPALCPNSKHSNKHLLVLCQSQVAQICLARAPAATLKTFPR